MALRSRASVRTRYTLFAMLAPALVVGQARPAPARSEDDSALASVLTRALLANPGVRATAARTAAAHSRISAAGSRPDPMLMSGLQNFPLFKPGFSEEMTMKMVGVSQTILFPGKQRLSRTVAEQDAAVTVAEERMARARVLAAVRTTWYDLAYVDAALRLAQQQRDAVEAVVAATLARYNAGAGTQVDVLTAQIEAAKAGDLARGLQADRQAAVATLNALLDRPSETPVGAVRIAPRIEHAALARDADTSALAWLRASALQTRATQESPSLAVQARTVDAQTSRVALARREARPDFDVVIQYGQRDRSPDMLTLQVSMPLRLQPRTKQGALIAAAESDAVALEAERQAQRNAVASTIATLVATLERMRDRLSLYDTTILPQRRAAVDASMASYRSGSTTLAQVLTVQAAWSADAMTRARTLSDFAQSLTSLELVVGTEVLP